MTPDLAEATTKMAELLWREANPECPISRCDAWDYCKAQAGDLMKVVSPLVEADRAELEQAHGLIFDLRAALAAVEQDRDRLSGVVKRLEGKLAAKAGSLTSMLRRDDRLRAWMEERGFWAEWVAHSRARLGEVAVPSGTEAGK